MTDHSAPSPAELELMALLRFDRILLSSSPLTERIIACLRQSVQFLDRHSASGTLLSLAGYMGLSNSQRDALLSRIVSIGHIGFMIPGKLSMTAYPQITAATGLGIMDNLLSRIFAKELDALGGDGPVETHICRVAGTSTQGNPVCIEMFTSGDGSALVNRRIADGVGTHVAFRVQSPDAVRTIPDILRDSRSVVPPFMSGQPMYGRDGTTLVLYCDFPAPLPGERLRVEFYYED